jgi:hypothetical protein
MEEKQTRGFHGSKRTVSRAKHFANSYLSNVTLESDDMTEISDKDDQARLENALLWGFLSTFLLGILGYLGLLLGAWPLLWLPLLSPVFAFFYVQSRFHSHKDFDRFLAGYGICLVLFILLGILFVAVVL